jgi:hypothetical protein
MDKSAHAAVNAMKECSDKLILNYQRASSRRNDIAHGIAWELSVSEGDEMHWYLVAPNYQSSRTANWIQDDIKFRTTGLRLSDGQSRFAYKKIYYNNSDYVFGGHEIKVFAGKFAYLFADLLSFHYVMHPGKTPAPSELVAIARAMSQ